jgi:hypothetical protein
MKYYLIYCIKQINLIKSLFITLFLFTSLGYGEVITTCTELSCPIPVAVKVKAPIDPIQSALDSIRASAENLAKANITKNDAQKALDTANTDIKSLTDKLAADRVLLNKLLDNINNNVPAPEIQIIEVYSDGCAYCDTDATIAGYVKEGLPIVKTKDSKWKATATPTFIALLNGKEVSRVVGILSKDKLFQWHKDLIVWSKQ